MENPLTLALLVAVVVLFVYAAHLYVNLQWARRQPTVVVQPLPPQDGGCGTTFLAVVLVVLLFGALLLALPDLLAVAASVSGGR